MTRRRSDRRRRQYRARTGTRTGASPSEHTPGGRHTYCPSTGQIDSRMRVSECHKIAASVIKSEGRR